MVPPWHHHHLMIQDLESRSKLGDLVFYHRLLTGPHPPPPVPVAQLASLGPLFCSLALPLRCFLPLPLFCQILQYNEPDWNAANVWRDGEVHWEPWLVWCASKDTMEVRGGQWTLSRNVDLWNRGFALYHAGAKERSHCKSGSVAGRPKRRSMTIRPMIFRNSRADNAT